MVKCPIGDGLELNYPEMSIEGSLVEDPKGNIADWNGKSYRMIPPSAGKLVEDPDGDLINYDGKPCKLVKPNSRKNEGSLVEDPKGNIAEWNGKSSYNAKTYRLVPPSDKFPAEGKLVKDSAGDLINLDDRIVYSFKPAKMSNNSVKLITPNDVPDVKTVLSGGYRGPYRRPKRKRKTRWSR